MPAERRNIVFIVAHPDDVAAAMAGTAHLLAQRYRTHVFCATQGERGLPGRDPHETAALRVREEQAACDLLGASLHFLGLMDAEVYAERRVCESLAEELRRLDPAAAFCQWPLDFHPDHAATSEIARKALHLSGCKAELYMGETFPGQQTANFHPDIYVDVSRLAGVIEAAVRCHVCQNPEDRLLLPALQWRRFRGAEARLQLAEGFKTLLPSQASSYAVLRDLTGAAPRAA